MDLTFLREVEVFRASRADKPLDVYMLMYEQSIDEQRYVMGLSRERVAFERLIRERAVRERAGASDAPQERFWAGRETGRAME